MITSPASEKSLSLATDVAGIASRHRVTSATTGYDLLLAAHQRSGHWLQSIVGSATNSSSSCRMDSCERPGAALAAEFLSNFDHVDSTATDYDAVRCGEGDGIAVATAATVSMTCSVYNNARWALAVKQCSFEPRVSTRQLYRIESVLGLESFQSNGCFANISVGTNLIHDFTTVTFSVKLAFCCEKRPFPCFREIP